MSREEEIKDKSDNYQNEYLEILFDILNHNTEKHEEGKEYIYWWERLKKLQQYIISFTLMGRELQLDKVKEQLELAFTPRIKSILSKKVLKEMEDE